jgi:hypothetical protein
VAYLHQSVELYVRQNLLKTFSYFMISPDPHYFYDISHQMAANKYQKDTNVIFSVYLLLNPKQRTQIWNKYDIFDWAAEMGGM